LLRIPFPTETQTLGFRRHGERCEGKIHRVYYVYNDEGGKSVDRITVQFTSKGSEFVTSDLFISGVGFLMLFKEGDRVLVIYDATDPTRFTLTELPSDPLVNAAFIIGGLFFLVCWR
jgi:hypothetical protein